MQDHIFRLMSRHQRLDEEVHREMQRRAPDVFRVQRLKRLKLAIKDRLNALARRPRGRVTA